MVAASTGWPLSVTPETLSAHAGAAAVAVPAEAGRDLQDALCRLAAAADELLLEEQVDLRPGHGLGDEAVAERLDGERLAVGDLARRFGTGRGEQEAVRGAAADAAGVHERDLGAAQVGRLRRHQLGVGDHVTRRDLAERVQRVEDVGGDLADDLVGERRRGGDVLLHDVGHPLVLGQVEQRHVGGGVPRVARVAHDRVVGAGRHELAGLVVDGERDVGEDAAERRRAGDQPRDAVGGGDRAPVLGMGVGRHDDLDGRVEPPGDLGDVAAREVPGAPVQAGRARLEAALVDHEHAGVHAHAPELRHRTVGGVGLVLEGEPGHARGGDDGGRCLEHLTDDADRRTSCRCRS